MNSPSMREAGQTETPSATIATSTVSTRSTKRITGQGPRPQLGRPPCPADLYCDAFMTVCRTVRLTNSTKYLSKINFI